MSNFGFETGKPVRARRLPGCLAAFVALAVLAGGGAFIALKASGALEGALAVPDYAGAGSGTVVVHIPTGASTRAIAKELADEDVVKSAEAFVNAAERDNRTTSIQPGYYRLHRKMSGAAALQLLVDPTSRVVTKVTVPEGMRTADILDLLSAKTGIPRGDFDAAVKDPAALGLPSYAHGRIAGYLFPATYDTDPGTTARSLLAQMVARFAQSAKAQDLVAGAKKLKMTPEQVVTIASLVEAEARRPQDLGKVSRVIYNRLAKHQKLQLDSTVHYALGNFDHVTTTAKDRAAASPYNTYAHAGLPPGPIDNPGDAALKAALQPTPGPWLYFVTVNLQTGETTFSTTAQAHAAAVKQFQRWCQAHKGSC